MAAVIVCAQLLSSPLAEDSPTLLTDIDVQFSDFVALRQEGSFFKTLTSFIQHCFQQIYENFNGDQCFFVIFNSCNVKVVRIIMFDQNRLFRVLHCCAAPPVAVRRR